MDNTSISVFDQVEDVLSSKTILFHHTWAVSFHDDIGVFDEFDKLQTVCFILQVEGAIPFAPIPVTTLALCFEQSTLVSTELTNLDAEPTYP